MEIKNKKIAIIGAGIAGITIASKLQNLNEVTVFEKSRGVGGRMSSRRVEDYSFDHGAQFFTAKTAEFKELCRKAESEGVIEQWNCNFVEIKGNQILEKWQFSSRYPHFVATPQMNSLCKYIGKDLNILLSQEIISIKFDNDKWSLNSKEGAVFRDFDYLILAIPSHQTINLIPESFGHFDVISNSKMSACFALMLAFKKPLKINFEAALVKESNISWISLNHSKPQRPKAFSMVVNSSNKWAEENIEEDLEVIKEKMISSLQKIINFDLEDINYQNIHRWKYANSDLQKGEKSLFDAKLNLGICGDWLISGRVESAFLSALDLYKKMKNL
jgi:predicted NAD/FAD-dependent oxidoreductase